MKFLLILLLAVPVYSQVATYDKFKDQTIISTDAVRLDRTLSLAVKGLQKGDEIQYYLIFRSSSRSWSFLRSHGLIFLADGERIDLGNGSHDGTVKSYGVTETMIYLISRADLEKLHRAASLEMKLGFFEVAFKPAHRQGIKEMLGYVVK